MEKVGAASPGSQAIDDLATLNEIIGTLNGAVDVRSALESTLARLVARMGLESGLVYVKSEASPGGGNGSTYTLAAHHNLPPAMAAADPASWWRRCRCQRMCDRGELSQAINIVQCSRLATAGRGTQGLAVHASVALRSGGRALGILNVMARDREAFGDRELALLTNVGSHMGIALERARLYDMLRERRVEEQAALLDLSNRLLSQLDLDDVMDCIVEEAPRLLGADASALLLPQGKSGHLAFRASSGWRCDPVARGVDVVAGVDSGPGLVMHSRMPLMLADVQADQPEACAWAARFIESEGFRAHALAPLIADGRSIGVLMLDAREARRFDADDTRLLQLLANQAAIAIVTARLREEGTERRRMEQELAVARDIQLGLLPRAAPAVPGWRFGVAYEPARQVGGDFYDIFELPDRSGEYGLVVADVAGKGVPASLLMAVTRTMVRAAAVDGRAPAAVLELVNKLLVEESHAGPFVTVIFAILNPRTGQLCFSNGGHMRPVWVRASGEIEELSTGGMALGVMESIELPEREIVMALGDLVLAFTDGVTDAMNQAGERFGGDRLRAALRSAVESGDTEPERLVSAVLASVTAFSAGAEQADDLAILALARAGILTDGSGTE